MAPRALNTTENNISLGNIDISAMAHLDHEQRPRSLRAANQNLKVSVILFFFRSVFKLIGQSHRGKNLETIALTTARSRSTDSSETSTID